MKLRYIKPGDTFTVNGRSLVFVGVENDTAVVRDARKGNNKTYTYGVEALCRILRTFGMTLDLAADQK